MELRMTAKVIATSEKMPPNGVLVVVAGGVARRKTGGEWFSGINGRKLNWEPKWWIPIPGDNDHPVIQIESMEG